MTKKDYELIANTLNKEIKSLRRLRDSGIASREEFAFRLNGFDSIVTRLEVVLASHDENFKENKFREMAFEKNY